MSGTKDNIEDLAVETPTTNVRLGTFRSNTAMVGIVALASLVVIFGFLGAFVTLPILEGKNQLAIEKEETKQLELQLELERLRIDN